MATEARKTAIPKFPLRLMPSVRRTAEVFSEKEGVSLNQFINVAVAEKLAHFAYSGRCGQRFRCDVGTWFRFHVGSDSVVMWAAFLVLP